MSSVVKIRHNGAATRHKAGQIVSARMREAARDVRDMVKERVSKPYPPASRPQQYPHRRSGRFFRSIRYRVDASKRQADIYTDDPKARWLEYGTRFMRPRPTFRKASREFKERFDKAFRTSRSGTITVS